ncbi:MAG: 2,3-diphosphoglycerate-dependent phosphoglycerate mutase [Bacilli bacterium]|nr:2,3-diphosphoglycerate-dependent phosphoglycerate mutase [Bacilli bacterium]
MKLVLVRHGESVWNKENRFTGWTDVALSEKGIEEAKKAGELLKEKQYNFDIAYTSMLKRANDTLDIILKEMNLDIPVKYSYKLNERHYGALQGLNKDETREKYGDEQVKLWRRSASVRPPSLTKDDPRYPGNDLKYKDLKEDELPLTENLNDTIKRVSSYYKDEILPILEEGKDVLVAAHGNSIRALIKYLDNLTDEEVIDLEIPTGKPICYVLNYNLDGDFGVIDHYYVEDRS